MDSNVNQIIHKNNNIEDVNNCIDRCSFNLTHFDVANIIYKIFKNKYRYIGNRKWEYYDTTEKKWLRDHKKVKFKSDIKIIVSDLFIQRSVYWKQQSLQEKDINTEIHAKMRSENMVMSSYKLKNEGFISVVIKEAQSFFDVFNVDE